ncbi:MAG: hypothetical protein AAGH48_08185 [Pseudomonadota bacterium]
MSHSNQLPTEDPGVQDLARAILACAADETPEIRAVVYWVIRNRARADRTGLAAAARRILKDAGVLLPTDSKADLAGRIHLNLVVPADDPTRGATRMHRHDCDPAWASRHVPTGLFGPWLVYRPATGRPKTPPYRSDLRLERRSANRAPIRSPHRQNRRAFPN